MEINKLLFYGYDPRDPATRYPAMVARMASELRTHNLTYLNRTYGLSRGYLRRIILGIDTPTLEYAERVCAILDTERRRGFEGRVIITDRWRDRVNMYIKISGGRQGKSSGLAEAVGMSAQHLFSVLHRNLRTLSAEKVAAIDTYMREHPQCPQRRRPAFERLDAIRDEVLEMRASGVLPNTIAERLHASSETIRRWLKANLPEK